MGCDGGTIPTRDELIQKKKKEEKVEKKDSLDVKWRHCAMSQEVLQKPIVSCELGRLFNKESVIKYLIEKSTTTEPSTSTTSVKYNYIRNLKDVKELKLTKNPAYKDEVDKAGQSSKVSQYICPISGLEMTGNYRFQYLRSCGCVFSERGLKEIRDGICVQCNTPYTEDEVIIINGSQEELESLEKRMNERRSKNKRKKHAASVSATSSSATVAAAANECNDEPQIKLSKVDMDSSVNQNNSNNSSSNTTTSAIITTSTTTTIKPSSLSTTTKQQPSSTKSSSSSSIATATTMTNESKYKESRNKMVDHRIKNSKLSSVQDDPNASETFKSLFNTHQSAKNKPKPHWVSCNPLYY